MNVDIDLKNAIMSSEQVETFSYNIFRDIGEYLNNHIFEYFEWNFLDKTIDNIIVTLDIGIIEKKVNFNYKLCQYHNNK